MAKRQNEFHSIEDLMNDVIKENKSIANYYYEKVNNNPTLRQYCMHHKNRMSQVVQ